MKVTIDGREIGLVQIDYREVGFGTPESIAVYRYALTLEPFELVAFLEAAYTTWVRDAKADFIQTGEKLIPEIHDVGYPPLPTLMRLPSAMCDLLERFLYLDLFQAVFRRATSSGVRWILNDIQSVTFVDGKFVLIGNAFSRQSEGYVGDSEL